ncbi:molybdopterin-dependent oxidoreductase [Amycolatopsis pithecellobii]|uniref:Molybdopterin-dependent oxidoreductase n=1 Tax=Amycolatopsis pithecellobii TaxID=664692 RepID=A0A6N7ZD24_9PSEU|nr:molybdopterin-dependent oxidoreductase [Amycolatopsis pithecellobii]MTD59569.1 molybdopterin-dependent oxidoreductase [Amycolatopsis pithecellobii]
MSLRPSTSHWGAFSAAVNADGRVRVVPHPEDPAPAPMLGNLTDTLHHPTRVATPAIRRGWLECGPGPDPARGHEEFVAVSWDEALDLLATEYRRIRDEHGNQAIFGGSYGWASAGRFHHAQSQLHRFLTMFGGFTSSRNTYSNGTSTVVLPHIVGGATDVLRNGSSWPTIVANTDLLVAFGGVPQKNVFVTPGGVTRHHTPGFLAQLGEKGVDVALISPLRNDIPASLNARWYPIRPATDTALMLALAHTLVVKGLHDNAFLDRYCAGYEEFERYLLGVDDGVPKNAAWASAITELPAADIVALARRMASVRTFITITWSLQRIEHGEQPVWAAIALAAMLGQIGLPGGGFGHGYGSMGDTGDIGPDFRVPYLSSGINPVREFIPVARIADMLLHPGTSYDYDGTVRTYPEIRLVHWAGGNPFHHHQDLNRLRTAFARPDTVVVQDPYWTATARHADFVLPATVSLEREDFGSGRRDTHLIAMHRVAEPFAKARDDHEILAGLAARLGIEERFTEGRSPRAWLEHLYESWRKQLLDKGFDVPSFVDFWWTGEYRLPAPQADRTLFADFRSDPVAHRLPTPSGKIEIASARVRAFGYDDCPGHPAWIEPSEWLGGPRAARFPLQLIANQPSTRLHSQLDGGAVSQAAKVTGREAIRMHPDDARPRGIAEGNVVRVVNDRGSLLAGAVLSTELRQGVVQLPTGAWFDPLPQGSDAALCVHGNPNVLTADLPTSRLSQGCTGQHVLVEIERYDGTPPPVTIDRPPRVIRR